MIAPEAVEDPPEPLPEELQEKILAWAENYGLRRPAKNRGPQPCHRRRTTPSSPGGRVSRVKANVAAIELAKTLEKEKRNPSPEEKKILAQFTGWGALGKEAFEPEKWISSDPDKNGTLKGRYAYEYISEDAKKEYKAWFERIGKKLHPELGGLLTEEEWDEAKSSILNAFYTSREVIENGLWPIIERLGFKGGTDPRTFRRRRPHPRAHAPGASPKTPGSWPSRKTD